MCTCSVSLEYNTSDNDKEWVVYLERCKPLICHSNFLYTHHIYAKCIFMCLTVSQNSEQYLHLLCKFIYGVTVYK